MLRCKVSMFGKTVGRSFGRLAFAPPSSLSCSGDLGWFSRSSFVGLRHSVYALSLDDWRARDSQGSTDFAARLYPPPLLKLPRLRSPSLPLLPLSQRRLY